ncbi:hypothetical protein CYMTET_7635 [Cymbomonas tetramitiformis]|uniref:SGNH hydrolase-type esterase domain-containing protein n=1 Tax=Cymbomonas tetramitiformis TaxID=36881 RepID=A0AAE0GUR9_9CHLO|nr:hypothetical protein CYMTET_7635 [Cymbomonas tetramitiformis]
MRAILIFIGSLLLFVLTGNVRCAESDLHPPSTAASTAASALGFKQEPTRIGRRSLAELQPEPTPVDSGTTVANFTTAPPAGPGVIDVACIGDSLSWEYPLLLQQFLGPEYRVKSWSVPCASVMRAIPCGALPSVTAPAQAGCGCESFWDTKEWKALKAGRDESGKPSPHVAIAMFGTSEARRDTLDAFQGRAFIKDFTELIASLTTLPSQPAVFVMEPPPMYAAISSTHTDIVNKVFPKLFKPLAQYTQAQFIDGFVALGGTNKLKPDLMQTDGMHPSRKGACVLAQAAFRAIQATEWWIRRNGTKPHVLPFDTMSVTACEMVLARTGI